MRQTIATITFALGLTGLAGTAFAATQYPLTLENCGRQVTFEKAPKKIVSIGQGCLLGAQAGIGISLGDDCVVEAGLYVTAGTRVTLPDGQVVKALELSGADNLLFRRNSLTGAVEALQRSGSWGGLNAVLHSHN